MLQQIISMWSGWPLAQRMRVSIGAAIGIAALSILVLWGAQPSMTTLMSNLSPQDAMAIGERLRGLGVPFKMAGRGTVVLAPQDRIDELRLQLAGEGLPKGAGVGFELFDDPAFGMSRFTETLNFRRGLEGELARTIGSMSLIREARVHLVMPKKSVFQSRSEPARASVTLHLLPGRMLSKENIQSIVHLVSSSVEGLPTDQVTIVDALGRMLSRGGDGAFDRKLEHQQSIENALEDRVREVLGRVVGLDNLTVRVTTELDFTKREKTQEEYDPDSVSIRSEHTTEESMGAGVNGRGGIPGARSNLSGTAGGATGGGVAAGSNKRSNVRNYEVSKEITHEVGDAWRIQRISLAVLVNGVPLVDTNQAEADTAAKTDAAEGKNAVGNTEAVSAIPKVTLVARSQDELDKLTKLAKGAIGYNATRGDIVEVQSMIFSEQPVTEIVEEFTWIEIMELVWRPIIALFLLIVIILVIRNMAKAAQNTAVLQSPRTVRELEAALAGGGALPLGSVDGVQAFTDRGGSAAVGVSDGGDPEMAGSTLPDPEKAAQVIRGWISES